MPEGTHSSNAIPTAREYYSHDTHANLDLTIESIDGSADALQDENDLE